MRIKWSHLIPTTLTVAVLTMVALGFGAQNVTAAASCGANDGKMCRKTCLLMCSPPYEDKCCTSHYSYFPKIDD